MRPVYAEMSASAGVRWMKVVSEITGWSTCCAIEMATTTIMRRKCLPERSHWPQKALSEWVLRLSRTEESPIYHKHDKDHFAISHKGSSVQPTVHYLYSLQYKRWNSQISLPKKAIFSTLKLQCMQYVPFFPHVWSTNKKSHSMRRLIDFCCAASCLPCIWVD